MRYATITATSRYLPEIKVSNDELRRRFEPNKVIDKFEAATGIRQRYYAPESWSVSDLALQAARRVLEKAHRQPEEIDLVILGTDSPDHITPCTSAVLQHKLGAKNAGTFDIGCGCASFATGLTVASGWLTVNPSIRSILLVGAYEMHKLADPNDASIFFYGDGAGAVLIEASAKPGFLASAVFCDGSVANRWGIYAGGTLEPATPEAIAAGRTQVKMVDRYPPELNHLGWPRITRELAKNGKFELNEIDQILFTQVNRKSIELVMKDLGLPMSKAHMIMEEWGYTGSACLPMALDSAVEQGKIKKGDLVAFVGSGVGFNLAAAAFRME